MRCTFQFLIGSIHNQNILEDAAWKALQFTYGHSFYNCTFCFQNRQNFEQSNYDHAKKIMFSIHNEFIFIISLLHHLICFIERKTKYTTRCSVKSSTIYTVKLIVINFRKRKILCSQCSRCPKLDPSKLYRFWEQKVQL